MISKGFKENQSIVKQETVKTIRAWLKAFMDKNPEKMLPFYAVQEDGFTFIYNNSEAIATDKESLLDAYKKIQDVDTIDVIFEDNSLSFPSITDSRIFCVGKHFVTIRKGTSVVMDLTYFTMILKPSDNGFKILHHHSSFPTTESTLYTAEAEDDLEPWPFYMSFGKDALHRRYKTLKEETPTIDAKIA